MRKHYTDTTDGWRWRFAILPFTLRNGPERTWIWWEWYQIREAGYYTEIRLMKPDETINVCIMERWN